MNSPHSSVVVRQPAMSRLWGQTCRDPNRDRQPESLRSRHLTHRRPFGKRAANLRPAPVFNFPHAHYPSDSQAVGGVGDSSPLQPKPVAIAMERAAAAPNFRTAHRLVDSHYPHGCAESSYRAKES